MKKQLKVTLYKSGAENQLITTFLSNYNEGKSKALISPRDFEGYLLTRNAIYPILFEFALVRDKENGDLYHVSEDGGKTFTMSIEWCEVHELPAIDKEIEQEINAANDLKDVNI